MTLPLQQLAGQLTFESGAFPSVVSNSASLTDLDSVCTWVKDNLADIEEQLATTGAILFRGFPVSDAESFDTFSAAFGYPSFTYKESLSNAVRINFTERVFTANEAPKDVEIFLHHEMAQTPVSPDKLFFFCKSAAESGGATPICRSDQLFLALQAELPELALEFEQKGLKYTTHMPSADNHESGQGRSWRSTLSAETVEEAETKLSHLGYSWKWGDDGSLRAITPVLPAVRTLSNGTKVFYNQLIAAYLGWHGVKEDPSVAITFGDGSKLPVSGLEKIVELAKQFTFDVPWQAGDVALIDNKMTMHGRRPFNGEQKRQVLVALAA
ncbi:TauD/TfdA family dioxygenase [Arenicella xantha]|uniref:Alpha-ketoglutarate-dependent taurine dioxygenase n=1 Tax=Arenicella xantha TaxID=644221 RepID=A0A395JFX9_9GAMM|nr:TauD/TfdA family dioxygenase [Arenicella xantha]RBP48578.1 alpha-ketoglutarate-dependent taurine dioxygenase [Arenicella xantha]